MHWKRKKLKIFKDDAGAQQNLIFNNNKKKTLKMLKAIQTLEQLVTDMLLFLLKNCTKEPIWNKNKVLEIVLIRFFCLLLPLNSEANDKLITNMKSGIY